MLKTVEDLKRVYFRVGLNNLSAYGATDAQFNAWAKTKMNLEGDDNAPWDLQERLDFCVMAGVTAVPNA